MVYTGFIFLFLAVHYSFFLFRIFKGLGKLIKKTNGNFNGLVTLIIPFRNESEKILQNLESIQNQNFADERLEVIYINDNSDDGCEILLKNAITKKNIRIINAESNGKRAHKKAAIIEGLKEVKGEIIVSTDSDCFHGKNWLKTLINYFDEETAFVSGPVEFVDDNTFFAGLQRLEFAGLIFTGAGLIGAGTPVICNAANLAYRKKIFEEVGGFSDNMSLSSGDDELLMQKITSLKKYKIKFCPEMDAMVFTEPNSGLKQLMNQRKRWASKGLHYKSKGLIFTLVLIFLFYLGLLIQPLLGMFISRFFFLTFAVSLLLKMFCEFIIIVKGSKILGMKGLIKYFIPAEIFHVPYIVISAIGGAAGGYKWRGRTVKR